MESKTERVKELRQEIAEIQTNQREHVGERSGSSNPVFVAQVKERRIQRLQEIMDELRSLLNAPSNGF